MSEPEMTLEEAIAVNIFEQVSNRFPHIKPTKYEKLAMETAKDVYAKHMVEIISRFEQAKGESK
jgi:hypothetical protein